MKELKEFKEADIYVKAKLHDDDKNEDFEYKMKEKGYLIDKDIGFRLDEESGLYKLIDIATGLTFAHCRKEDIMTIYRIYKPELDKMRYTDSYMFQFMKFLSLPEMEVKDEKDENGQPMLTITLNGLKEDIDLNRFLKLKRS